MTTIDLAPVGIAAQINEQHRLAEACYGSALEHAVQAGRLLIAAKSALAHGEWGAWQASHLEVSERTAQLYAQLASASELANPQRVADLSLREAVRLVGAPKPKKPTTADASALLQGLAGDQESAMGTNFPDAEVVDVPADAIEVPSAWSDQQARKLDRVRGALGEIDGILARASDGYLRRSTVADVLRDAAVRARQNAAEIETLAFTFER